MAYLAVEKDGSVWLFQHKPKRQQVFEDGELVCEDWQEQSNVYQEITEMTIEQLIGSSLTWEDEPVELKIASKV